MELLPFSAYPRQRRLSVAVRTCIWAARVAWLVRLVGAVLIIFYEVESVIVTGPILLLLGVFLFGLGVRCRYYRAAIIGAADCLICFLFFGLVWTLSWSPTQATVPFGFMSAIYLLGTLPAVFWVERGAPRLDPLTCLCCGYSLRGLTVPRCPECGNAFDPALLDATENRVSFAAESESEMRD